VGGADWRAEAEALDRPVGLVAALLERTGAERSGAVADGGAGVAGTVAVVVGGAVGEGLAVAGAVDAGGLLVAGGFVVAMRVGAGLGIGIWAGSNGGAATIGAPVRDVGGLVVGLAAAAEVGGAVGPAASSGYCCEFGATGPTARLTSTRLAKTRQPNPNA
jgi:hypothetical protein